MSAMLNDESAMRRRGFLLEEGERGADGDKHRDRHLRRSSPSRSALLRRRRAHRPRRNDDRRKDRRRDLLARRRRHLGAARRRGWVRLGRRVRRRREARDERLDIDSGLNERGHEVGHRLARLRRRCQERLRRGEWTTQIRESTGQAPPRRPSRRRETYEARRAGRLSMRCCGQAEVTQRARGM